MDYYVAKWVYSNEPVIGFPDTKLDFVFYIEGDKAKRAYNNMIHERWVAWRPGQYTVENRYGLWLCKDDMPIERHDANSWRAQTTDSSSPFLRLFVG